MHKLLHVPYSDNPTWPGLSAHAQRLLHISSLLAIGTLDIQGRPWTTLLGGAPGFARSLGQSIIRVKTLVNWQHDPVLEELLEKKEDGAGAAKKTSRAFSALGIHLATRARVKLHGQVLAGERAGNNPEDAGQYAAAELQMVFAIEGSLGTA